MSAAWLQCEFPRFDCTAPMRAQRRNRAIRLLWILTLASAPGVAQANSGIGFFIIALPLVVLALAPAILLEALVLGRLLPVPPRRALRLSLIANLQSTLWGVILAIAVDFALMIGAESSGLPASKESATAALVPLFFLTWLIEFRAIAKRAEELPRPRIARVTGAANLLTYALMIAFVWTTSFMYQRDGTPARTRVSEAFLVGMNPRSVVEEFYESKGRLPRNGEEAAYPRTTDSGSKYVSALEIRDNGVVVITLAKYHLWPEGGEIRLTPTANATATALSWKCRSTLAPRYLPPFCRE